VTTLAAPPREYTSLEDFENHYSKMDAPNFTWYHRRFQALVIEIYSQQGVDFLTRVKAEFSDGTTRKMSTTELVSEPERINPGFRAWATSFSLAHGSLTRADPGNKVGNECHQQVYRRIPYSSVK
jgi:hypothetical protein